MKKIIIVTLMVSAAMAEMATIQPVREHNFKDVLVMPIVGAVLLPGLVLGDLQWQIYTNRGNCNAKHNIITLSPLGVKVPCDSWYKKN